MFRNIAALGAAVCLLAAPLMAQTYTGTYAATNDAGGQTVVVLRQGQDGKVTGTIEGKGNAFQVEGVLDEGSIVGAITGAMGGAWFEAELDGDELYFTFVEPDANGQPNYETATTMVFARSAAVARSGTAGGGNPLAGSQGMGSSDPWVGAFSDGTVVLQLQGGAGRYTGTVSIQGHSFPATLSGTASALQGTFRTADGEYAMELAWQAGSVVLATGGTAYALQRTGGGAAANPLGAGGAVAGQQQGTGVQGYGGQANGGQQVPGGGGALHDGTQAGREWAEFLAGKKATQMSSYSSGSAGGYSSRTDVHLCPNGQFTLSGNSTVSADVGGVSGYSGGNSAGSGTWRIITQGQVAGIELRYANGGVEQYRLDYQDGATYVNGERWYITPSEACGY